MHLVHVTALAELLKLITGLLILFALVMFLLAGLGVTSPRRFQFLPWGLFAWLLSTVTRFF